MKDMYRHNQPLDIILKATFREMKMCYEWSKSLANDKSDAIKAARAEAKAKAGKK